MIPRGVRINHINIVTEQFQHQEGEGATREVNVPGGVVVRLQCSHCSSLGSVPTQGVSSWGGSGLIG